MLGKLAITSSYGTVYIFSAELFPTVVRNVGMGTASLNARIGGILCPYINMLRWKLQEMAMRQNLRCIYADIGTYPHHSEHFPNPYGHP